MNKKRTKLMHGWLGGALMGGTVVFALIALYGSFSHWFKVPFLSLVQRMLGFAIDFFGLILLLISLLFVSFLPRIMAAGEVFSRDMLRAARRAFIFFLAWTVYALFERTLVCLVLTMHNPVGHRILSVSVGTPDLIRFFVVVVALIFLFVLQRGHDLSEDQSLTI